MQNSNVVLRQIGATGLRNEDGQGASKMRRLNTRATYTRATGASRVAPRVVDDWGVPVYASLLGLANPDACNSLVSDIAADVHNAHDFVLLAEHFTNEATAAHTRAHHDAAKLLQYAARVCYVWNEIKVVARQYAQNIGGEVDLDTVTDGMDAHMVTCLSTNWAIFSAAHVKEAFVHTLHCRCMQIKYDKRLLDDTLRIEGPLYNAWRYDVASNLCTIGVLGEITELDGNDGNAFAAAMCGVSATPHSAVAESLAFEASTLVDAPAHAVYVHHTLQRASLLSTPPPPPPVGVEDATAPDMMMRCTAMWDALQLCNETHFVAVATFMHSVMMRSALDASFHVECKMREMRIQNKRWTKNPDETRMLKILSRFDIVDDHLNNLRFFVPSVIDCLVDHASKGQGAFRKSLRTVNAVQRSFQVHTHRGDGPPGGKVSDDELKRLLARTHQLIVNVTRSFVMCIGKSKLRGNLVFVELFCAGVDVSKLVHSNNGKRRINAACFGASQMGIYSTVRTCAVSDAAAALIEHESLIKAKTRAYASPGAIHDDFVANTTPVRSGKKIPCAVMCVDAIRYALQSALIQNKLKYEHYESGRGFVASPVSNTDSFTAVADFARTGSAETTAVFNAVANVHAQRQQAVNANTLYEPGVLGAMVPDAYICRPHVQQRFNHELAASAMHV